MFASAVAAAEPLEPCARLVVEAVAEPGAVRLLMARLLQVGDERAGRSLLHLLPRGAADREVRGDEADDLAGAVLGGQPLEHRIGVGRVPNGERPHLRVDPDAVPDEEAAGAAQRHERRQRVGQLALVRVAACVEEVVAVEEVEGRLSHRAAGAPRRGTGPRRR